MTYDTNKKKVSFILSFLMAGEAVAWKQQWITEYTAIGAQLPIWADFKANFLAAFLLVSDKAVTRAKIKALYQDTAIDDYITQFRMIAA
jgi:hypothetical protein